MSETLELERDGAVLHSGALSRHECDLLSRLFDEHLRPAGAGTRLVDAPELAMLVGPQSSLQRVVNASLGSSSRPVRALLFDKRHDQNWALGWHQDRTIVVSQRCEVTDFGPWSFKNALWHVEPPFELLQRMRTVRVHLDPCDVDNAPLLISPGTHRCGRIPVAEIEAHVARHGVRSCLADSGDVWMYATPILHASDAATRPRRRRVLQLDYADFDLPGGLQWRGV